METSFIIIASLISILLFLRSVLFCGLAYTFLYNKVSGKRKFNEIFPKSELIREEMFLTLRNSLTFTFWTFLIVYLYSKNVTLIYTELSMWDLLYVPLSFMLMFVIQDTYFYWAHYLMHSKAGRWTQHSVHHKFHNPTPWSSYAMSVEEFSVQHLFYLIIVFMLPLHPLTLALYLIFSFASNVIGHCGYELWKPTGTLLGNSEVHYQHHKYSICNFSLYLTYWDKMMGTSFAIVKNNKTN